MMSCIAPTKRFDMWLRDRSVKTTEYSRRPSGSISGRGRVTSAGCHTRVSRALAAGRAARSEPVDIGGLLAVGEARVAGTAVEERLRLGALAAQLVTQRVAGDGVDDRV